MSSHPSAGLLVQPNDQNRDFSIWLLGEKQLTQYGEGSWVGRERRSPKGVVFLEQFFKVIRKYAAH